MICKLFVNLRIQLTFEIVLFQMPDLFSQAKPNLHYAYPMFSSPYNMFHPGFTPPSMTSYLNLANKMKQEQDHSHMRQQLSSHFIPINDKQENGRKETKTTYNCSYCTETFSDVKEFKSKLANSVLL